jgi:two-component system chemotaxis sensor kinase CheA
MTEPSQILERLAGACMLVEPGDDASLAAVASALEDLRSAFAGRDPLTERLLVDCGEILERVRRGASTRPEEDLQLLCDRVSELQQGRETQHAATTSGNAHFVLPAWIEESVFAQFMSNQPSVLEAIESDMLALADGEVDALADLRGKVHSLKGEAGILGLKELESVCHTVEDLLNEPEVAVREVDQLLLAKDWMTRALAAYSRFELPDTDASTAMARQKVEAVARTKVEPTTDSEATLYEGTSSDVPPEPVPTLNDTPFIDPSESRAETTPWDDETLAVAEEFLQESEEGLAQVDQILLEVEQQGVTDENVNAMFRVFHTIKGVAGFLELHETSELAHATETLLGKVREHALRLDSAVLDRLFSATTQMRAFMDAIRAAVTAGHRPNTMTSQKGEAEALRSPAGGQQAEMFQAAGAEQVNAAKGAAETSEDRPEKSAIVDRRAPDPVSASPPVDGHGPADAPATRGGRTSEFKEVVKVDVKRIDNLVELIGELVIVESMIVNSPAIKELASPLLRKQLAQMSKITRDLQDIGTSMRMIPVRGVFQKMARMVRDLSRSSGKAVRAVLRGENTEVDRSMVEQIADPLLHMIRNAVDHGIEGRTTRQAAGKAPEGRIELRASHRGGTVVIEVVDDGRGLDRASILAKARERGIIAPQYQPTDREIDNMVFAPGFSTAKQVSTLSGRGVGMDVVKRNVEAIRGKVKIDSVPGQGTTFTMVLPLTLGIIDGMLATCGAEHYIVSSLSVVELVRPKRADILSITGKGELIRSRQETIPLLRLDRLLEVEGALQDTTEALVVVVDSRGRKIGLLVDSVVAQQQVVIKALGAGLPGSKYLAGSAILSDGRVGLILDTDEIAGLVNADTFVTRCSSRSRAQQGGASLLATESAEPLQAKESV